MPNYEAPQPDRVPETSVVVTGRFIWTGRTSPDFGNTPTFRDYMLLVEEVPEAYDEVVITVHSKADIGDPTQGVRLEINGVLVADMFYFCDTCNPLQALGCTTFDVAEVRIPAHEFNTAILNNGHLEEPDQLIVQLIPVGTVSQTACNNITWVEVEISFLFATEDVEPLDLKLWGEDLCQNAVFSPVFLPDAPFALLQTTHLARVVAQVPSATEEVCKFHRAELIIDHNGFAKGFYCSRPVSYFSEEDQQNHYADLFIVQSNDEALKKQVPIGFGCFVGAYHAPRWTELQLWSHIEVCGALE